MEKIPDFLYISEDIDADQKLALQKETRLSKPDKGKLRELMKSTYGLWRKNILSIVQPISKIVSEYPPLATSAGVSRI